MPLLDVRADHLKIVQSILQKFVPEHEVWAFGSRAKWLAKEYSDLDLCIVGETPLSFRTLGLIEEAFEESDLPYKVDVVDWATTSESFRKIIERDRVVVQKGGRAEGMKTDWKTYTLSELGQIKTGKTPPSLLGDGFGGTVPFVTPGDMNGQKWLSRTDRYLNERGLSAVGSSLMPARSVAVSCIGSDMGKAALLYRPSVTNQQINTIAVDESRFNAEFIYYDLSVRQQELKAAASGSATPILNKGHFSGFEISVPPRSIQDKIAEILGKLDDKIDLNRRINQTLEAMAQAIFKSWFIDFDPVKAKIAAIVEGRDPLRAAMSAISGKPDVELDALPPEQYEQLAATAALFPDEMEESELGKIPGGWRHSTIGEEVTVCGGATPSTKEPEFWEGGQHCWATPKDLSALKFPVLLDTDRKITDAGLVKISSGLLPVGTVLLSSRAPIGYLAIAKVPTAINQGFIAMKCDGDLSNVFVLQWCRESMDAIVANANGSTFQEISKSNFRPLRVVVPSASALTSFTKSAGSLYRQLAENERESSSLAQLRNTLLPKLISGELRISDAERFLSKLEKT